MSVKILKFELKYSDRIGDIQYDHLPHKSYMPRFLDKSKNKILVHITTYELHG